MLKLNQAKEYLSAYYKKYISKENYGQISDSEITIVKREKGIEKRVLYWYTIDNKTIECKEKIVAALKIKNFSGGKE